MGNGDDADKPLLEYCMKISPNTLFSVDRFFKFVREELQPAPFHRGTMVGMLRDKAYGMSSDDSQVPKDNPLAQRPADNPRLESFWGNEYEGVHLYVSGQLYILSHDLIEFILTEVPHSRERIAPGGYIVGREGHDISSMAYHSPMPIQFITISRSQRFWTHPLKIRPGVKVDTQRS